MKRIKYELLGPHVFVTKLAGFEHSEYIQHNQTNNKANNSDIPLVQGKNIRNGKFIEQYDWYIKKEISDYLIRSKLTKNCILVPYVGSNLGEVGIFYHPYDCHLASNIAKIELLDDYFELEYLKYYLQSPIGQNYLFQSKQGSAQPNITMESIRNTLVIDYPKHIQEKIISILRPIDLKIEANTRINTQLEELAKTIYDYWFLQFEFPNEEGKPYKSSGGKMVYNEQLKREIPEGWEVVMLSKVSNMYQPNTFDAKLLKNDGKYRVYGAGGYMGQYDNYNHEEQEIFISCRGSCGNIYKSMPKSLITGNAMIVHANDNIIFHYLYLTLIRYGIKQCITGTVQPQITRDNLKDWIFILPPNEILKLFNLKISSINKKQNNIIYENQELSSLVITYCHYL